VAYGKYSSRSDFFAIEPYYKTRVGDDDRYIPGGFDYGVGLYDRTRKGAYAAVQWQPAENLEIDQTYFESRYQQDNLNQGVFLIQTGIARLLALFPDRAFRAAEINAYNRDLIEQYQWVRDFIILHYKATERDDSAFWRRCRDMQIPGVLQDKIDLFLNKGRVLQHAQDLFTEHSWIAVMLGQGITPPGYDPLVDSLPLANLRKFVRHTKDVTAKSAAAMPTHQAFIDRNCSARS
jgi:Tryptophan halogenase